MSGALTALLVFLMAWFAIGSLWNIRKGNATMRWMEGGLPLLGARTTVRWLGTTSVEMILREARPPFEQMTLVIFLEPRDVPWIWGFTRRRGRRDTLIVRAQLARAPLHELEVLDRASWSGRDAWRGMASERWSVREPTAADDLRAFYKFESALTLGDTLLGLTHRKGMAVRRLSVHRGEPHLQLHVDLPALSTPAVEFFGTLRVLGQHATGA